LSADRQGDRQEHGDGGRVADKRRAQVGGRHEHDEQPTLAAAGEIDQPVADDP
jgi:hypothetical protein